MQYFDINIAPNATRKIDAEGRYIYYYAGSAGGADSTIAVKGMQSGYRALLLPGQGLRLPQDVKESTWLITNYANAGAILGRVVIGAGEIQDNRSTGVVEVVDGGYARSLGGTAFISSCGVTTAVATDSTAIELWNKHATLALVVEQITVMSSLTAPQPFTFGFTNTQLAALFGTANAKKAGGATSTAAELRTQAGANATLAATLTNSLVTTGATGAFQPITYTPKEPIIVPPGKGLLILDGGAAGVTHSTWASFEHYEQ